MFRKDSRSCSFNRIVAALGPLALFQIVFQPASREAERLLAEHEDTMRVEDERIKASGVELARLQARAPGSATPGQATTVIALRN